MPERELKHQLEELFSSPAQPESADRPVLPAPVPETTPPTGRDSAQAPEFAVASPTQALAALQKAYDELELRIKEQATELLRTNEALQAEIAARQRAEAKARNSEAFYHSLVESLPQNIFRKDRDSRFTFGNSRFCALLGKAPTEILGKSDFDFYPPELAEKYVHDDRRVMESGESYETVEAHQPPGGGRLYVKVIKTPVRDAAGEIIGTQCMFWDVTESQRAEAALAETHRLARRSQLINQIAGKMRAAVGVDEVLRIATDELRRATHSTRSVARLSVPERAAADSRSGGGSSAETTARVRVTDE